MALVRRPNRVFEQQADAYLSQANPVSATLYTVLPTTRNVRITSIYCEVVWATTQPTPMEIVVTIGGVSQVYQQVNPVTATGYFASVAPNQTAALQSMLTTLSSGGVHSPLLVPFVSEGSSVKVEIRITWATTQPTPLKCRVKYARVYP